MESGTFDFLEKKAHFFGKICRRFLQEFVEYFQEDPSVEFLNQLLGDVLKKQLVRDIHGILSGRFSKEIHAFAGKK